MPTTGQVSNELERCITEVLEAKSDAIISLSDLQAALEERLAARAPGPASLMDGIQRRPDLFVVLRHAETFPGAEAWPRDLRTRYDSAFSSAGFAAEPHIALQRVASQQTSAATTDANVLGVLQHSVLRLWRVREKQPAQGLGGAVNLFDTVRTALHLPGEAE